jgi:hypothetical protein
MKHKGLLAVLAASMGIAFTGLPGAGDHATSAAYAQAAKERKKAGIPVGARQVELRRGGYYSYGGSDVTSYRGVNRMFTPLYDLQSPAGPFDSGFFFDSGLRPHWWNNAPYPN